MKAYTITLTFDTRDERDEGMEHLNEMIGDIAGESAFDELTFETELGEKEVE